MVEDPRSNARRASQPAKKFWIRWSALALMVAAGAFALWRFGWVPARVETLLARGEEAYVSGDMTAAVRELERVQRLDPDHLEGNVLLGWSHWRLGNLEDAEQAFARAHEVDPGRLDAIRGLGQVLVALGEHQEAVRLLENAAWSNPLDLELHQVLAEAYRREGRNVAAARIYRELLWRNPGDFDAEEVLLQMFGYPQLGRDVAFTLPERRRPPELVVPFRALGDLFQANVGDGWRPTYLNGVILSPAQPGEYAVTASLDYETYRDWLNRIGEMSANTVRVYTILPPAFYQALAAYNAESEAPIWLIQGVWLDDLAEDLFDPETSGAFDREIRDVVDVIHGQADVACRPGHYCGVYTADISPWVLGIALGRDLEPVLVRRTNAAQPDRTSYRGEYVSLADGNPSEVWFARMLDLAASYEVETYNAQRPLTVVNWPALDPMAHPAEPRLEDELRARRALGEVVPDTVPVHPNDLDGVAVDIARFQAEDGFEAGLFALYHVFQHRPSFLYLEERYAEAQDAQGNNSFFGYLQDLKAAHPDMPLVVGAFGIATSAEPVQLHPAGWHNGGLTEDRQAELLVRFSRNIRDTGGAGGIVFEWLDEWWKQVDDPFVAPLEGIRASDPLWLNRLDPEEAFGLVGFRPFERVPLLRGDEADWRHADPLYPLTAGGADEPALIRGVWTMSDYAYLYVRVDVGSASPEEWSDRSLWLALNTLPGEAGSFLLPGLEPRLGYGATFLVQLDGLTEGRLLVAENYHPWESREVRGRPDISRIRPKERMTLEFDSAGFEEMVVEINPPRWMPDGTYHPPSNRSWSPLLLNDGTLEESSFAAQAAWFADEESGTVEVRIPWSKLLVIDPSKRMVLGGIDADTVQARATDGVAISAFAVEEIAQSGTDGDGGSAGGQPRRHIVRSSLPRLGEPTADGRPQLAAPPAVYAWEEWNDVLYRSYLKPAYYALQDLWGSWPRWVQGGAPAVSAEPPQGADNGTRPDARR